MSVLMPPSAFKLPGSGERSFYCDLRNKTVATQATVENSTSDTQTCSSDVLENITELEDYISRIVSADRMVSRPLVSDTQFEPIWSALSKLEESFFEKVDTVDRLSAAVHRTVPESLEHQRLVQNLDANNQILENEIIEKSETISLLEKRLECQGKVLTIQEKTLTTDGTQQKMLKAWRQKVLQMLVEKEMGNVSEFKTEMVLKSQIEKLEKACRTKESEVEILTNKNADLLANLKLKDKHIHSITNELSLTKHSEMKFDQLNALTCKTHDTLFENISNMGENFEQFLHNQGAITEKLTFYEEQIIRISESVIILQSLYAEKEEFYSNKLESLLVEHTKPLQPVPRGTSHSQTETTWSEVESNTSLLNTRILEHSTQISSLTVEKGLVSAQLAEAEAARCELKHKLSDLRDQVSTKSNQHEEDVMILQKRESKAAIRAKHVERLLTKREEDIQLLEEEFTARWTTEVDQFQSQLQVLKNENLSLKQALKRG